MDDKQQIQSKEYQFPYHYIPAVQGSKFQLSRRWAFAPSYLAALQITHEWLEKLTKDKPADTWRHIDLGCGDGAFVYYLKQMINIAEIEFSGTDYDESAIVWARLFNPENTFYCDKVEALQKERYHSATLVEVAEHIPPDLLPDFAKAIADVLVKDGKLLVTVPHKNKRLFDKHYQHFSFDSLSSVFEPYFEVLDIKGFESLGWRNRMVKRFMSNKRIYVEWQGLSTYFVKSMAKMYSSEKQAGRIVMKLRKLG